jgi:hypothetical protein
MALNWKPSDSVPETALLDDVRPVVHCTCSAANR